jgi:hypothetical protein
MASAAMPRSVKDRSREIEETFRRIRRPLRWPMRDFRRAKVASAAFVGYRFSRVHRSSVAGFAFGFALRQGVLPGIDDPPEVVAYAFVRPVRAALHAELVTQSNSPIRRLVRLGAGDGYPYEFHPDGEVVAVRHRSLRRAPPEIFVLSASDFYMVSFRPMQTARLLDAIRKATTRAGP